jgi:hypothetical protein
MAFGPLGVKIGLNIRSYSYLLKNHRDNRFWDIIHSHRMHLYMLEALISIKKILPIH